MVGASLAFLMLCTLAMMLPIKKTRKILIPDVPPPISRINRDRLIIAGAGIFSVTAMITAIFFLLFVG